MACASRGARSRPSAEAGSTTTASSVEKRSQRRRPRPRTERPGLPQPDLGRHPEQSGHRRSHPAAHEHGPTPALGDHLGAPARRFAFPHGHQRDHSAAPTRSPSMTAACARRGATQSPTRSTTEPALA